MMQRKNTTNGFSLVETLVAITILTVAISATLSLVRQGLSSAFVAKDQMVAFYLAVGGMETVRHVRDSNVLSGTDWLDGFRTPASCFDNARGCIIDSHTKNITNCSITGCDPLQYNASTNEYGYGNGGVDTSYIRTITMEENVSNQEVTVTVTVSWQLGSFVGRDIVLEERLLNWTAGF